MDGGQVNVKGKNRRLPLQKVAARYEMHIAVAPSSTVAAFLKTA